MFKNCTKPFNCTWNKSLPQWFSTIWGFFFFFLDSSIWTPFFEKWWKVAQSVYNLYVLLKTTLSAGSNINQRLLKTFIRTLKPFNEIFLIQPIYLKTYLNFRPLFYGLWDGNLTDMLVSIIFNSMKITNVVYFNHLYSFSF